VRAGSFYSDLHRVRISFSSLPAPSASSAKLSDDVDAKIGYKPRRSKLKARALPESSDCSIVDTGCGAPISQMSFQGGNTTFEARRCKANRRNEIVVVAAETLDAAVEAPVTVSSAVVKEKRGVVVLVVFVAVVVGVVEKAGQQKSFVSTSLGGSGATTHS
jgi:hypothetical protein